jgi:hypothetical protein
MTGRAVMAAPPLAIAIVCLSIASLGAHDRKTAGPLTVVLGWASEPAYSGALNAVIVSLSDRGGPLTKAQGALRVEVAFGSERTTLALEPMANRPHEFQAAMVPTRAGTYTFRVTGTINQQPIDVSSTCSDATFHCVTDAAAIQFPVKDPTVGQLAERIDRALPRAEDAGSAAAGARTLAVAAIGLSVFGLIATAATILTAKRNAR